jgi:hypothetical protein
MQLRRSPRAFHDFWHCCASTPVGTLSPMEFIATITWSASFTCVFALIGIIWKHAERVDEAS